jgi:hypothetical protein
MCRYPVSIAAATAFEVFSADILRFHVPKPRGGIRSIDDCDGRKTCWSEPLEALVKAKKEKKESQSMLMIVYKVIEVEVSRRLLPRAVKAMGVSSRPRHNDPRIDEDGVSWVHASVVYSTRLFIQPCWMFQLTDPSIVITTDVVVNGCKVACRLC